MSQGNKIRFFITGATGYIGGGVLARLLQHPQRANFELTVILRSAEKAEKLRTSFGVDAVVGSFADLALMERLAEKADVILSMADADDLPAAQAMLRGMKKHFEQTGVQPIFIHTSGTGVLSDTASGMYATDEIYSDMNPNKFDSLPPTQIHRHVDLEVIEADRQGYLKLYLVYPVTIYGIADHALAKAGIANPHSIQIPALIQASLSRGQAGMVGLGRNIWHNVHIDDIADLYIVLYDAIAANPNALAHGHDGIYIGENGEHTMYEVGKALGQAMVELGKATNPEPTTFTKADIDKYFGGSDYLGVNSRVKSERSRSLGWKPKKTKADFLASIKPEVEALIAKPGQIQLK
ncbi:hypothetical protein AMATHDRAFT_84076 [Amanita thiersii Skay4041]|uniref:NAD(P)-binding domain-containing protein n=1 Tax=Amanita thiersii Skay4041 TaxID=703135 RepID=A0A2A9NYV8_9AGAR|nr:hypothetical protein AMATHDRAFT_84076 [Amanita thiersii Skay4041]